MSTSTFAPDAPHVVVVGGGYAGIAAATTLAKRGTRVTLLESRRHWGGRATSWPVRLSYHLASRASSASISSAEPGRAIRKPCA